MLASWKSFIRVSASASRASYCLICSSMKRRALSLSRRLSPRPDSTNIETKFCTTRLARSGLVLR